MQQMADMSIIFHLLTVVGLFTILILVTKFLNLVIVYLRPSRLIRYAHPSVNGDAPWALVTGASDGIGRAFARQLAAAGFNVVLHGRNYDKLSGAMAELQIKFPRREFMIIIADASCVSCADCLHHGSQNQNNHNKKLDSSTPDFAAIQQKLGSMNLTVLINNAGGGPVEAKFEPVSASPEITVTENISLNALFPLHLTRVLLPTLVRNGPSLVMNLSTMADQGFPLIAYYSASKAFLMATTRALRFEMQLEDLGGGSDVEILGIRVGRVTDTAFCREPPSLFLPSAETLASAALARAGYGNGIVEGYWAHALQQLSARLLAILPKWVEDKVVVDTMRKQRESVRQDRKKD
ncbi:hypothetical protein PG987_001975 [Apiospora arundinis]